VIIENDYRADLSANALAQQVDVSPFRFQRAFRELVGESYAQYVRRLRLERATSYLKDYSCEIRDIATQSGFWTAAGFTRAFTKQFGMPPSAYRTSASVSVPRRQQTGGEAALRHRSLSVLSEESTTTRIAFLRGSDDVENALQTWDRLLAIATSASLVTPQTQYLGLHHDGWDNDGAHDRYDAAITIPSDLEVPAPLATRTIPGGHIVCTSVADGVHQIGQTWEQFYRQWLPDSQLEARLSYVYDEYFFGTISNARWLQIRAALGGVRSRLVIPVSTTPLPINSPNQTKLSRTAIGRRT